MIQKSKPIGFSLFLNCAIFLFSLGSYAAEPSACYNIEMKESPVTESIFNPRVEVWCYQKLTSPAEGLYVYNADSNQVKPELAFVLGKDGTLTHASLVAGKLTVHRLPSSQFNPFSIPLEEPKHLQALPKGYADPFSQSAEKTLTFLFSHTSTLIDGFSLKQGTFNADATMPWRGYWWPYRGQPLSGTFNSPMAKYDRFVSSQSGSSPGAAEWENSHHYYKGVWWEGHCNGWAASSILRSEPEFSRADSSTGITFSVSDIKGLFAEADACVSSAFFGHRYRGPGDDINDIYPALFHKTITYYVGALGKPVAMDYHRDAVVDNHIISGYSMTVTQTGTFTYNVTTVLRMHKYDGFRTDVPGIAPIYTRTYQYTLREDASGDIVDGSWISTNPDFLWVPLSPGNCSGRNRGIDDNWINTILNL